MQRCGILYAHLKHKLNVMAQDDLKPYNTRPGEANTKARQPEKSEERYPSHHSKLEEQGKISDELRRENRERAEQTRSQGNGLSSREYRIW